jgi:two-component system chemotaxis sensor kinase CheA
MLTTQQKLIPLLRLASLYGIDETRPDPNKTLVVVVKDEERMAGLLVDELIGRQTIVIKTLGGSIKDIPGISGATILPDGRVALILDVGGLLRLADVSDGRHEPLMTAASEGPTLIMQDGS